MPLIKSSPSKVYNLCSRSGLFSGAVSTFRSLHCPFHLHIPFHTDAVKPLLKASSDGKIMSFPAAQTARLSRLQAFCLFGLQYWCEICNGQCKLLFFIVAIFCVRCISQQPLILFRYQILFSYHFQDSHRLCPLTTNQRARAIAAALGTYRLITVKI